jgi:hypothetical protein
MYFVVMPRVNRIVIFLTYHVYLYSINSPTVICLPSMCYLSYGETPLVNYGPRSYFHHILLSPVYFTRTIYFTHILLSLSTRYTHNRCFRQTGEIDNLIASWEQSIWLCVCRFHVAACKAKVGRGAIYKLSRALAKLASITFSRIVCSSPDRHTLVS